MEDWVAKAQLRWPNVPDVYGWLGLDARGHWLIKGERISRPQIIDTIAANYAADAHGRWYFQNGPQRGFVTLESAPLIIHAPSQNEDLRCHTGAAVQEIRAVYLDESGGLMLLTEHGPAALLDADLPWALQRLFCDGAALSEAALEAALALGSGQPCGLQLQWGGTVLAVQRLDFKQAPLVLGFVRSPLPNP